MIIRQALVASCVQNTTQALVASCVKNNTQALVASCVQNNTQAGNVYLLLPLYAQWWLVYLSK